MKRLLSTILAMSMLLSVTACGSSESTSSSSSGSSSETKPSTSSSSTSSTPASTDAAEEETDSGINRGGTLVVRRMGISPINPTKIIATTDAVLHDLFFEALTFFNFDGEIEPWLAESWEYSEDGLVLSMKLREDAVFSDGTPVNAEAVVATMDFYRNDITHAQGYFLDKVLEVNATGDYSVEFVCSSPDSFLINSLSQSIGIILNPVAIEEFKQSGDDEIFARKGGSGPFVLDSMLEGDTYNGVANKNYYRMGEDGKALPYVDAVQLLIVADEAVVDANLKSQDIHIADVISTGTYIEDYATNENVELIELPTGLIYNYQINVEKGPLSDVAVRKALCYAIDSQELIDTIFNGMGCDVPNLVAANQPFYVDGPVYAYEPETAKQMLADAGYPDGVDIDFYYGTYGVSQIVSELMQMQAKKAGFNLNLIAMDGAALKTVFTPLNDDQPAGMRLQELDMPRASAYIQLAYFTGPDSVSNASRWEDPEFTELLNGLSGQVNQDEQYASLARMQEILNEQLPVVAMCYTPQFTATSSNVNGETYDGIGNFFVREAWLSK